MENKWILSTVCLLAICITGNLTSGKDVKTPLDANKTTPQSHASAKENLQETRHENVEMGTNVSLLCNNLKIAWKDMFYVIWNISLQGKSCYIGTAVNDTEYNTCQDGKKIDRGPNGDYYLSIPNVSIKDEGNYTCEVSYRAGGLTTRIAVSSWAQPHLYSWLEAEQDYDVAICEAVGGKPEASIDWETTWNSSLKSTKSMKIENGLFTVRSWLPLPKNASLPVCLVTVRYPNWTEIRTSPLDYKKKNPVKWLFILMVVCATCFTVMLLTVFYLMRERLLQLSIFRKVCHESKSSGQIEEKLPQSRDLEEVEPYASYVQRVNSIYNSSADLFND